MQALPNAARVFAHHSETWGGAPASVVPMAGSKVCGSVIELSAEELKLLDPFEVVAKADPYAATLDAMYRRQDVVIDCDGEAVVAVMYVIIDQHWVGPPSAKYLDACRRNLEPFWPDEAVLAQQLEVRDAGGHLITGPTPEVVPFGGHKVRNVLEEE